MFVIRNDPIKYFKAQGIQWYIPNSAAPPFVILRSAATLFFYRSLLFRHQIRAGRLKVGSLRM